MSTSMSASMDARSTSGGAIKDLGRGADFGKQGSSGDSKHLSSSTGDKASTSSSSSSSSGWKCEVQQFGHGTSFPKGHMQTVEFANGMVLGRATMEPGWKYSVDMASQTKTALCQHTHAGFVLSGAMCIRPANGPDITIRAGDAFFLSPNHDAWTLGDEPCVLTDCVGAIGYGSPPRDTTATTSSSTSTSTEQPASTSTSTNTNTSEKKSGHAYQHLHSHAHVNRAEKQDADKHELEAEHDPAHSVAALSIASGSGSGSGSGRDRDDQASS